MAITKGSRPDTKLERIPKGLSGVSNNLREIIGLRFNTQAFNVMSEMFPQKIIDVRKDIKKKKMVIRFEQEFRL